MFPNDFPAMYSLEKSEMGEYFKHRYFFLSTISLICTFVSRISMSFDLFYLRSYTIGTI